MSSPSPRPSPRPNPSLCLQLTHSPEVPQLHLQPLSFLQWLPSLLLWLRNSALEPQVDLDHSLIKNWGLLKLHLPPAQAPLSLPASSMLSRGRNPEYRRSSTQHPLRFKTKAR
jgi:hypothetical protein